MASLLPCLDAPPVQLASAPDVSVVIVNYNVRGFLEQALESVERASAGVTVETIVVDNNSADGSARMVRERFPQVRLIANEDNTGFATANNQGIRIAEGRHLLILNPDTLLQEDTLRTMVAFMDAHPEAGAVGCRILNPDGTFAPESRRAFPTPSVAFYRMSGLGRLFPEHPEFGRYNMGHLPQDAVCEVDALSGSCMMVRRDAVCQTDAPILFDEDFFMYGEDLDWCYRIQQAGWKIFYTPDTQIVHYKGESTKKGELRYVRLFYGAMLRFSQKHFDGLHSRLFVATIRLGIVVHALLTLCTNLLQRFRAPLLEWTAAWTAASGGAAAWSILTDAQLSWFFYTVVSGAYAALAVLALAGTGGFRPSGLHRFRPLVSGLALAFVSVTTVSFFVQSIAYSRGAVVLSFAAMLIALSLIRLTRRAQRLKPRRTLLVGSNRERDRLAGLMARRTGPSAHLVGHVGKGKDSLGPLRQLRDLVRLHEADHVVFAADSLSNTRILALMQQLKGLPVQFKILSERRDLIVGKASVEDFSAPLVDAERALAPPPSTVRYLLDLAFAFVGMLLYPLIALIARLAPSRRTQRLRTFAGRCPEVLKGDAVLVGYLPGDAHPPAAWGLKPGLVSILDALPQRPTSIVESHRAYWFYAQNRSLTLDLEVLARTLL